MTLKPITVDISQYPAEFHELLAGAKIYDSSCSSRARVVFIDRDAGYFLKSAPPGALERQAAMTRYFHSIGLTSKVISYVPGRELVGATALGRLCSHDVVSRRPGAVAPTITEHIPGGDAETRGAEDCASYELDWLLTEQIPGDDCTAVKYLDQPKRLVDTIAEQLSLLHATDFSACPIQNHTELSLATAKRNMQNGTYDKSHFPDSFGYKSPDEAWAVVESQGQLLQNNTLLHGDYCLPNIILDSWRFSGFIDLDNGGVGDRHFDLFWLMWSLAWNLKTDKYRDRFLDAYGRGKVDDDILRIVAAVEVFG